MKRTVIFISLLAMALSAAAQVATWTLHPEYDHIQMLGNGFYAVSKNGKYGMMNSKEQVVVPLEYDGMSDFASSTALLYKGNRFVAIVSDQGQVHDVASMNLAPVEGCLFSDGYLPVRKMVNNKQEALYFLRAKDATIFGPYSYVQPFCEGYAVVCVPHSVKHIDGSSSMRCISAKNEEEVPMSYEGSSFDDVDFISTASYGKSIVIIKKRVFVYDYEKRTITPLTTDGTMNKKSRVFSVSSPADPTPTPDGYNIRLKQGNMSFDQQLRLKAIHYVGQEETPFEIPEAPEVKHESDIQCYRHEGTDLLSLSYQEKDLLPPQFEELGMLWGEDAIVKRNGKWGVVTIDGKTSFRYILNDNLDLGFEHKAVKTNIKLVGPPSIELSKMKLSSLNDDCLINTDTRKETANVESAVLAYECTLTIPEDISVERSPSSVEVEVSYDGLQYVPQQISFNTWYINNYTVEIVKHQLANAALDVDIVVKSNNPDAKSFYKEVSIEGEDSVQASITKITEEQYKAHLTGWRTDRVKFNIEITEDGCSTLEFPLFIDVKTNTQRTEPKETVEAPAPQVKVKRSTRRTTVQPKKEEKKKFKL